MRRCQERIRSRSSAERNCERKETVSLLTELIQSILPSLPIEDSIPTRRMMSPDGSLGEVPLDCVEQAQAEGFHLMTDEEMAGLLNRQEMTRRFFEKDWTKTHKP